MASTAPCLRKPYPAGRQAKPVYATAPSAAHPCSCRGSASAARSLSLPNSLATRAGSALAHATGIRRRPCHPTTALADRVTRSQRALRRRCARPAAPASDDLSTKRAVTTTPVYLVARGVRQRSSFTGLSAPAGWLRCLPSSSAGCGPLVDAFTRLRAPGAYLRDARVRRFRGHPFGWPLEINLLSCRLRVFPREYNRSMQARSISQLAGSSRGLGR